MTRMMAGFAAMAAVLALSGGAMAAGDVAEGAKVFKKCAACHKVEAGKNGVGPSLHGVVGAKVAHVGDYKYSEGMKTYAATGAVWDETTLDHYLTNPKAHVKGTKMSFAGLSKPEDRANVIAYLAAQK